MKNKVRVASWSMLLSALLLGCSSASESSSPANEPREVAAKSEALLPPPVSTAFNASADTYVAQPALTTNYGSQTSFRVTGAGLASWRSGLVKFDQAAIRTAVGAGSVVSATLDLTIDSASLGWANSRVSVSRMTMPWTENGATWLCANDTDNGLLGQFINNCSAQNLWGMDWLSLFPRPYASTPTASTTLPFGAQGTVSFDVTADVRSFVAGTANEGWLVSSDTTLSTVWVQFRARQTANPPRLRLVVQPPCIVTGPDTTCDGEDNDCNGLIDDHYVAQATSCGVGACARTGQLACVNGNVQNTCAPGTPAANDSTCNGVDNDCNGSTDEDYVVTNTNCGVGGCARTGKLQCISGHAVDSCTPGTAALTDTTCNRVDDNCNGSVDEGYNTVATSCGLGSCQSAGATTCVNGAIIDSCTPAQPAPGDTSCTLGATPSAFQCPPGSNGVCPRFVCVQESQGVKLALFEVVNVGSSTVTLPLGTSNTLSPSPTDRGQPTEFSPGTSIAFKTPITGDLTWQLGEGAALATLNGPPCSAAGITQMGSAPVIIRSFRAHEPGTAVDAQGSYGTGLPFEIPERLKVTLGNAGNGTAELVFTNNAGAVVTCTYRGRSSVASPVTDLDRALGRYYHFESCSNGAFAGNRVIGTNWSVRVLSGDPQQDTTAVELQVGPGCSGELDPPLWPEETVKLRNEFDWEQTNALPETDSEGFPALVHALIYVESPHQVDALQRMKVFFRSRPLFASELERYRGKCGTFSDVGDNHGQFVFSIIPAKLYNYFRARAIASISQLEGNVDFRAIVLRPIPEGMANQDGTLSWQVMKDSGFLYLGSSSQQQSPFWLPIISDGIECWKGDAKKCVAAFLGPLVPGYVEVNTVPQTTKLAITFDFTTPIADAVQMVQDTIDIGSQLIGFIDEFVSGKATMHLNIDLMSADPLFDSSWPVLRGWGKRPSPNTSAQNDIKKIVPHGARAEIVQLALGVFPMPHTATIQLDGSFNISVAKGTEATSSALCLELANDAARLSSSFTTDEFCNFGNLDKVFGNFEHDIPLAQDPSGRKSHHLEVSAPLVNALTQLTDGWDYVQHVVGLPAPRQAQVGLGLAANTIGGFNENRAFVPCLNFPEMKGMVTDLVGAAALTATAIPVAGLAIPVFGPLLAPLVAPAAIAARLLFEKDMFLMENDPESLQSRGVVSHEYGHFVMCDVFSRVDSDALTSLYAGLLADGVKAERRTQDIPVMLESFADFIASQLTGGANYSQIHDARASLNMRFCDGSLNPANPDESCFERNHRGVNDSVGATEFQDEVARRMTTYHDAFDARVNYWRDETHDVPTNADPWKFTQRDDDLDGIFEKQVLSEAREPYISGGDDFVELPGAALRQWFTNAWEKSDDQQGLSITRFLAGLSQTMTEQHGVSWCDACDMFVKHDNMFDASPMAGATQQQIWAACNSGELREILGPPPDADLRLDKSRGISTGKNCAVCTGRDFSNADGLCETCPDGTIVVHNVCEPCPPGEIQVGNVCQTCGSRAIAVNNMCESCPEGRVRYPGTNECASCAPDAIVNWAAFERPGCADKGFLDIGDPSASMWGANDLCPDFFVVELKGLATIASTTPAASRLRVRTEGYVAGSPTAAECATHTEHYRGTNVLWLGLAEGASTPLSVDASGAMCPSFNTCPHQCLFPATVVSDFASSTFDASADTLRVMVRTDTLTSPETKLIAWTDDKCSIIN